MLMNGRVMALRHSSRNTPTNHNSIMTLAHITLLLLAIATKTTGYLHPPDSILVKGKSDIIQKTGIKRSIVWTQSSDPVPIRKEVQLLRNDVLIRRGEFGPLRGSRELEVELECSALGLTFPQGKSIRKQLMVKKSLVNDGKLRNKRRLKQLAKAFAHRRKTLLEMSHELDLPPVSIFRAIVSPRVLDAHPLMTNLSRKRPAGRIVQSIISESDPENIKEYLSSDWELKELQKAKQYDMIGHSDNSTCPMDWENSLYGFLDQHNINYVTEEVMKQADMSCTPDCLILDDLYINQTKVRWIEFKSYYASGLRENAYFTRKTVSKQVAKYEREFGNRGAVIMKNGFSELISKRHRSTLFLDGGPLNVDVTII